MSVIRLIDDTSNTIRLVDQFSEFFISKSGLLDKSFDLDGLTDIDAAGLDRLSEVSRSLGDSSSKVANF